MDNNKKYPNEIYPNSYGGGSEDEAFNLRDTIMLIKSKWYWFVFSLIIALGLAALYVLTTPPTYVRRTSILIKDRDKNNMSTDFSRFSSMGIGVGRTNLYNEMITFKSPTYMMEVVKQLHLDIEYKIKGTFHDKVLYGKNLPIQVTLPDVDENTRVFFSVNILNDGKVQLTNFWHTPLTGEEAEKSEIKQNKTKVITATFGEVVQTPVGSVLVSPTQAYTGKFDETIFVRRYGFQEATDACVGRLNVDLNNEKSSVVDLSYTDQSPDRAVDVLNTLFEVYNKMWVKDINEQAESTSDFIDVELQTIQAELGDVDANISSYKSQHLVPDIATAAGINMNKAETTSSQLLELSNQLTMAKYILNQLSNEANRYKVLPANSGIDNGAIAQQISVYNDRVLQRNALVSNSSVNNPIVADLEQNIEAMRQAIIASLNNIVVNLQGRVNDLQGSASQTQDKIASNPTQAKDLLGVERQQKVKEQLYIFLLQKREENQLSKAFTSYNTKMINPPAGSKYPSAPVKSKVMFIAFALGLLIPAVLLILMNSLRTTVRGRKELDGMSVPFVGEIPLAHKKHTGLLSFLNYRHKEKHEIVVKEQGGNIINEAFRVVRTNYEFMIGKDGKNKVVVFTSANPGSGKTFVAANLAMSFALKGKRVLVVDLDLRKGTMSDFLCGEDAEHGITDYLSGMGEDVDELIVKGKHNPNMDVLPIGIIPPNPTELLLSDSFEKLIGLLRERYDLIFIDCPPMEVVADVAIVNTFADMTLYIIRVGLMDRRFLPEIDRYYTEKRLKNMAVILNGVSTGESVYGYGSGYGSGYGYGKGYGYGYGYGYGHKNKKKKSRHNKKKEK